jgi:hypothetical protein
MSGLWTNDRDTLAKGIDKAAHLWWERYHGDAAAEFDDDWLTEMEQAVECLTEAGVVRVLNPDDPIQRGRVAKRLREIEVQCVTGIPEGATDWAAAQLIEALRQP